MKKIRLISIVALLLLASCLSTSPEKDTTPVKFPPTTSPFDRTIYEDGLIAEYQSVLQDLPYASMYDIIFNIDEDLYHVTGTETVIYTNAEEIDLNEIKFRLFPNILGGDMHVDEVIVNGKVIIPNYSLNDSLLTVPLKQPLKPGENISLSMSFNITITQSVDLNYGVQAYHDGVLTLAHAYPMIAVYDDEGWNAEIPPQSGDVTYADMAFFIVTVEAPKDIGLVGSGREISRQDNVNRQTVKYEAGPVRDFYLAASPDYIVLAKEVKGTAIKFYIQSQLREGAKYALDIAARAIEIFSDRYAPYPYRECQISWANKVHDVCGVIWKVLLVKLPAVEGKNK